MQQLVTNLRRYGMSRSEINEAVREAMDKAEKSM
jgi:flavin-binding protein dodecin